MNKNTLNSEPSNPLRHIGDPTFFIPPRHDKPELLDQGEGSAADVRASLNEMWWINRVFGGISALTAHLFPLLRRMDQPVSLADVGTGSAEVALHIAQWAEKRGISTRIYALDFSERNLNVAYHNTAHHPNIHLVQADVNALPFAPDHIDYYFSSLFLHHFDPQCVVQLLREMYRRARHGIIMSDLVRGYLPMLAFRMIQPVFARNFLTRHDGMLSVRRAYTPEELLKLAQCAGIPSARVFAHFPWRMTLVAEKSHV